MTMTMTKTKTMKNRSFTFKTLRLDCRLVHPSVLLIQLVHPSVTLSYFYCFRVSGLLQSVQRPRDMIYFPKATYDEQLSNVSKCIFQSYASLLQLEFYFHKLTAWAFLVNEFWQLFLIVLTAGEEAFKLCKLLKLHWLQYFSSQFWNANVSRLYVA